MERLQPYDADALVERSKVVLLADEGCDKQPIAIVLGITENKVGKWVTAMHKAG